MIIAGEPEEIAKYFALVFNAGVATTHRADARLHSDLDAALRKVAELEAELEARIDNP